MVDVTRKDMRHLRIVAPRLSAAWKIPLRQFRLRKSSLPAMAVVVGSLCWVVEADPSVTMTPVRLGPDVACAIDGAAEGLVDKLAAGTLGV